MSINGVFPTVDVYPSSSSSFTFPLFLSLWSMVYFSVSPFYFSLKPIYRFLSCWSRLASCSLTWWAMFFHHEVSATSPSKPPCFFWREYGSPGELPRCNLTRRECWICNFDIFFPNLADEFVGRDTTSLGENVEFATLKLFVWTRMMLVDNFDGREGSLGENTDFSLWKHFTSPCLFLCWLVGRGVAWISLKARRTRIFFHAWVTKSS